MIPPPPRSTRTDTLFPYTARFRSRLAQADAQLGGVLRGDGAAQRNRLAIDELGFLGRLQIVGRAAADVLVRARQRADADAPRADGGREGGDRPSARGITKKAPVTRSLPRLAQTRRLKRARTRRSSRPDLSSRRPPMPCERRRHTEARRV